MPQNLDLKFQIEDLRESGISFFQKKVRFGVKTLIWALVWNGPEQMKMIPIKPIIKVKINEELDNEEGKSIIIQIFYISNHQESL